VLSIARQGGREVRNELPLPEDPWLTPQAAHRYRLERFKAGEEKITYRTIDGQNGVEPTLITHERVGRETLDVNGRELPVTVWNTSVSVMPGMSATSKFSADGHSVYEKVSIPFGTLITRLVSREEAMAAGAGPAPELMVNTFVEPDKPIDRPRETTTATLRLRVTEGEMPELPSAGAQRVEIAEDRKTALLTIDIHDGVPAAEGDEENKEYLQPSAAADSADPMIVALAKRATKDVGDDPMERAEAMRRFVHRHISSKALDTAFATASETARMKAGDCSEHGVLLTAMLRADGIPARAAMGLVYADSFAGARDIFGWHMWTQALIDGNWFDLDATLDNRYDAGHVLTGTSSLADGVGASAMAAVAFLLGNLEIEVVEVGYERGSAQP
jgi:transglutaminase-like putative cysteine protease